MTLRKVRSVVLCVCVAMLRVIKRAPPYCERDDRTERQGGDAQLRER